LRAVRGGGLEVSDCGSECCQLVSDCFKLGGDRVGRCVWRAQSAVHDLSPFLQAKLLVCGNHQPECRGGGENDECCGGEGAEGHDVGQMVRAVAQDQGQPEDHKERDGKQLPAGGAVGEE